MFTDFNFFKIKFNVPRTDSDGDAALFLLDNRDIWWLLVETNTEAMKLLVEDALVVERLHAIEHDQDDGAGVRGSDNLTTTTLTVLGTFHNTGKIQQLHLGALVTEPNTKSRFWSKKNENFEARM